MSGLVGVVTERVSGDPARSPEQSLTTCRAPRTVALPAFVDG